MIFLSIQIKKWCAEGHFKINRTSKFMNACTQVNDHLNANSATRPSLPAATGESTKGDTRKPDSMNAITPDVTAATIDIPN